MTPQYALRSLRIPLCLYGSFPDCTRCKEEKAPHNSSSHSTLMKSMEEPDSVWPRVFPESHLQIKNIHIKLNFCASAMNKYCEKCKTVGCALLIFLLTLIYSYCTILYFNVNITQNLFNLSNVCTLSPSPQHPPPLNKYIEKITFWKRNIAIFFPLKKDIVVMVTTKIQHNVHIFNQTRATKEE